MKRIVSIVLILAMALAFCSCGVTITETNTTTENGKTTTTTTNTAIDGSSTTTEVTTTGKTLKEYCEGGENYEFILVIENNSDVEISELYIVSAGSSEYWNVLNEGYVIAAKEKTGINMTLNSEYLDWEFGFLPKDSEGAVWFDSIDLSDFDPDNDYIEFALRDDGWHLIY